MAPPDGTTLGSPAQLLDFSVGEVASRVQDALGRRRVGV